MQSPGASPSTLVGNHRPTLHEFTDHETKRLKVEMDEIKRFMQNQRDQLTVPIRTATGAAMAATEASRAMARIVSEEARLFVFAHSSAAVGPQAPVKQGNTRYAGVAEAATPTPLAQPAS